MGTAAAPPKRYVWDEFDDGEEANYQTPARRRSRASAKYAWDDEEAPLADGDASFEAARAQIRRLQAQLAEAKDVVRKRRVENLMEENRSWDVSMPNLNSHKV